MQPVPGARYILSCDLLCPSHSPGAASERPAGSGGRHCPTLCTVSFQRDRGLAETGCRWKGGNPGHTGTALPATGLVARGDSSERPLGVVASAAHGHCSIRSHPGGVPVSSGTKATRWPRFRGGLGPSGARDSRAGDLVETLAESPHAEVRAQLRVVSVLVHVLQAQSQDRVRGQVCPSLAQSGDTQAQDAPFLHRSTPYSTKGIRELKPPKRVRWELGGDQGGWCRRSAGRARRQGSEGPRGRQPRGVWTEAGPGPKAGHGVAVAAAAKPPTGAQLAPGGRPSILQTCQNFRDFCLLLFTQSST